MFVVVANESRGSGAGILESIASITTRYAGAGVQIAVAVSVLVASETVAEHIFSASRALTLNFKSLSTSRISIGNGVPLSFGHSRNSRRVFSSICSRVTVSGLHHFGVVVAVTDFWCSVVVSVVKAGVGLTVVLHRSRARCFFAAFFQILSMITKNGMCCTQHSQMELTVLGQ